MNANSVRRKFEHFRTNLEAAGLSTVASDSLVCPLCWCETSYDQLTLEHFVPGFVGGKDTVLTCTRCNNDQGSSLDSHLANYQRTMDAYQGHGEFQTKLDVNGHKLVATLEWLEGRKNFRVVGKATNPSEWNAAHQELVAGRVADLKCTVFFGYSKKNFERAVLRAAYLVAFKCFGYEYVTHEILQVIRRSIVDPTTVYPRRSSLIIEVQNFTPPSDLQHYVIPGNVNGVELILVVIRVRRATTKFLGAFLPIPGARSDEFFPLMEMSEKQNNGKAFKIRSASMFY